MALIGASLAEGLLGCFEGAGVFVFLLRSFCFNDARNAALSMIVFVVIMLLFDALI